MKVFKFIDLFMYAGFSLSTVGWAIIKEHKFLGYMLNFLGGITVMMYGWYISSIPIIIVNGIWASVSAYHLLKKEKI